MEELKEEIIACKNCYCGAFRLYSYKGYLVFECIVCGAIYVTDIRGEDHKITKIVEAKNK